ncbi:branched-chain amino acid ABC transporter permease [Halorubrum sp. Ib24]|uniref:AzlC family ABC transporter permease n=1 Tax=Halorubrum sp. Ib24 TaxID=1383850 RepID=UPI000B993E8A|nr:AzlC family ABC transporter permease [Halorubrum sp. Ib24]OYR40801.1 branched-chain amino acid ABC transporter permease [Halorubrum sp. Ib24]
MAQTNTESGEDSSAGDEDMSAETESKQVGFSRNGVRAGFVTCVPVALGVGAYGLVFGVLAREAGLSLLTAVVMSATVLAGAAQLIAVGLWDWPIPVVAGVGTTLVVNLRYLLMGASLRPWFTRLSSRQAYTSLFFMADENWALTIQDLRDGNGRGAFLLGSGLAIWVFWVACTAIGAAAGSRIGNPEAYGLGFVLTAIFLALLVSFWEGRSSLTPWIVAAVVALSVDAVLPGRWYILAGGLAASLTEVTRNVR